MEGFKIKCTMCGGEDIEIYDSNVYVDYKKIGFDISFYCKECSWEEVFKEIREDPEGKVETKIIKVIVNKLPNDCDSCTLREGEYCKLLGPVTGQEWIDLYSEVRDIDCSLAAN